MCWSPLSLRRWGLLQRRSAVTMQVLLADVNCGARSEANSDGGTSSSSSRSAATFFVSPWYGDPWTMVIGNTAIGVGIVFLQLAISAITTLVRGGTFLATATFLRCPSIGLIFWMMCVPGAGRHRRSIAEGGASPSWALRVSLPGCCSRDCTVGLVWYFCKRACMVVMIEFVADPTPPQDILHYFLPKMEWGAGVTNCFGSLFRAAISIEKMFIPWCSKSVDRC